MADAGERWAVVYQPLQEMKSEGPWETRRAEFVGKLPDEHDPAIVAFLTHLDELAEERRDDLLRTEEADTVLYGYLEEYPDSSSESGEDGEDETQARDGTWAGFIEVNVPYWDGEEDTWDTFREWFVYHADAAGFGAESAELFAELDTQDIDSRIITFGRRGGTVTRRGGGGGTAGRQGSGKSGTGNTGLVGISKPDHSGGTRQKSARLAEKVRKAVAQPPTLTVTIQREGVLTQVWAQAQNIGFHMYATLTTPQGTPSAIAALYELRQYVRDAFDRGGPNVQALSPWAIDPPVPAALPGRDHHRRQQQHPVRRPPRVHDQRADRGERVAPHLPGGLLLGRHPAAGQHHLDEPDGEQHGHVGPQRGRQRPGDLRDRRQPRVERGQLRLNG